MSVIIPALSWQPLYIYIYIYIYIHTYIYIYIYVCVCECECVLITHIQMDLLTLISRLIRNSHVVAPCGAAPSSFQTAR